ncbi:MAG: phosphomannomutase/phosphoglucomutase, partial [Candidatus Poribacteria bacterium]|nr:phosphomannomutase/phosphoglucomutase [Candidatus Poribacteria bacterium]
MQIDSNIFKAYDIRGIYPSQINEKIAESIGRAFITFTEAVTVIVGRDMRQSSPPLFNAVTHGIITSGTNISDIGLVSTDQFYYACATQNLPGIMITASHNPAEYGGFKMLKEMPHVIGNDTGLQQIHQIIETENFHNTNRTATIQTCDLTDDFVKFALSVIDTDAITPIQIAVDPRSGMAGPILQKVFNPLPVNLSGFNLKANGQLPIGQGLDPKQAQNHADL